MTTKTVKRMNPSERGEIIWLLESGYSPEAIMCKLGVSLYTIRAVGREEGLLDPLTLNNVIGLLAEVVANGDSGYLNSWFNRERGFIVNVLKDLEKEEARDV